MSEVGAEMFEGHADDCAREAVWIGVDFAEPIRPSYICPQCKRLLTLPRDATVRASAVRPGEGTPWATVPSQQKTAE